MASIENGAENMKNAWKNDFFVVLNFTYFTSEPLNLPSRRSAAFGHTSTVVIPRRKSGAPTRAPTSNRDPETPALRNRKHLTGGGLGASDQVECCQPTVSSLAERFLSWCVIAKQGFESSKRKTVSSAAFNVWYRTEQIRNGSVSCFTHGCAAILSDGSPGREPTAILPFRRRTRWSRQECWRLVSVRHGTRHFVRGTLSRDVRFSLSPGHMGVFSRRCRRAVPLRAARQFAVALRQAAALVGCANAQRRIVA